MLELSRNGPLLDTFHLVTSGWPISIAVYSVLRKHNFRMETQKQKHEIMLTL